MLAGRVAVIHRDRCKGKRLLKNRREALLQPTGENLKDSRGSLRETCRSHSPGSAPYKTQCVGFHARRTNGKDVSPLCVVAEIPETQNFQDVLVGNLAARQFLRSQHVSLATRTHGGYATVQGLPPLELQCCGYWYSLLHVLRMTLPPQPFHRPNEAR